MKSTLTTASKSSVVLAKGATAGNVFWQVGSSATLGTNTAFEGSILANISDTVTTGASVTGRVFALTGAVTLSGNRIRAASKETAVPVAFTPTESGHLLWLTGSLLWLDGQSAAVLLQVLNRRRSHRPLERSPYGVAFLANVTHAEGPPRNRIPHFRRTCHESNFFAFHHQRGAGFGHAVTGESQYYALPVHLSARSHALHD